MTEGVVLAATVPDALPALELPQAAMTMENASTIPNVAPRPPTLWMVSDSGVGGRRVGAYHAIEPCLAGQSTTESTSWADPIECHSGPLREFGLNNFDRADHTMLTRRLHAHLQWRNANKRDSGCSPWNAGTGLRSTPNSSAAGVSPAPVPPDPSTPARSAISTICRPRPGQLRPLVLAAFDPRSPGQRPIRGHVATQRVRAHRAKRKSMRSGH